MLGHVMQAAVEPPRGEVSTKLVDALLANLRRPVAKAPEAALLKPEDLDVWFSASDVHNLCPRLLSMAVREGLPMKEEVDADLLFTFAVGTGYHRAFQDELLPVGLRDVFQGCWERTVKGQLEYVAGTTMGPHTERGWGPHPEGDRWRFVEPKGRIPHVRLVGKWDGVLAWPDAPHEVLELKSIKEEQFASVSPVAGGRPRADHVLQIQAYLWMSGLDWGRLVYVHKGSRNLRDSVAEHVIARDEDAIRGLGERLEACLTGLRATLAGEPLPPKLVGCRIKSDPRARRCACKATCFALAKAAA